MIWLTLECGLGKPLCEFLGCEVPPWEFPRANTGDEFLHNMKVRKKQMGKMVMWNRMKTLVPITTVGIAVGAWLWMRCSLEHGGQSTSYWSKSAF